MYLEDTLSRAPMKTTEQHSNEEANFEVMTIQHISSSRLEELREHTAEDKDLQAQANLPTSVRQYFAYVICEYFFFSRLKMVSS